MKAKEAILLYWAICSCIEDFFKTNPNANPDEYYLLIEKAGYGWQKTTGNPYVAKAIPKSEADISVLPCLNGLYEDVVDQDRGDVFAQALLDRVAPIIDDWFRYNR